MGTFKRTPFEIDTSVKNGSKYLNQMQFNGIVQNNNTFDVDQNSLTDALNIYVNDQNTLVSREPLVNDTLDVTGPDGSKLIDIKEANSVKVYIFKKDNKATIIAKRDDKTTSIECSSKYNVTIYNQYIICFREAGAKVIDTNATDLIWEDFSKYSASVVTKLTTGNNTQTFENNQFTDGHIERYVRTSEAATLVPKDTSAKTTYSVYTDTSNIEDIEIDKPWEYTNERLFKPIDTPELDGRDLTNFAKSIQIKDKTIIISQDNCVLISQDLGDTFRTWPYPQLNNTKSVSAVGLSDDGNCIFYVSDNIYCYDLTTNEVYAYSIKNSLGETIDLDSSTTVYHYISRDNFILAGKNHIIIKSTLLKSTEEFSELIYYRLPSGIPTSVKMSITSGSVMCNVIKLIDGITKDYYLFQICGNAEHPICIKQFRLPISTSKLPAYDIVVADNITDYNFTNTTNINLSSTPSDNCPVHFDPDYIWTDGVDTYHSNGNYTYRYDITTNSWSEIVLKTDYPEYPNFTMNEYGNSIVKINGELYIHVINYSVYFKLDKKTKTWRKYNWPNPHPSYSSWSLANVFTYDRYMLPIYADDHGIYKFENSKWVECELHDKSGSKLSTKLNSLYFWTDGIKLYSSNSSTHYELIVSPKSNTIICEPVSFTGLASFSGTKVWQDGLMAFCYAGGTIYYLNQNAWTAFTTVSNTPTSRPKKCGSYWVYKYGSSSYEYEFININQLSATVFVEFKSEKNGRVSYDQLKLPIVENVIQQDERSITNLFEMSQTDIDNTLICKLFNGDYITTWSVVDDAEFGTVYRPSYGEIYSIPTIAKGQTVVRYVPSAYGLYIITHVDDKYYIYSNILLEGERFEVDYTYGQTGSFFTKVPTLTYSGHELYLAFDNKLQITTNEKNDTGLLFKLPSINNQAFANKIIAIINISTTELAIFFENGITICSKVADELTGYRYDYAKTRLTVGTKFGDSVINTADGASTLYATPRGLAIMNYQAYMATTDQTLQFISDKIYAIWNKFYLNSENITLIQHGDYVFVYNTSNQYLMLDLRNYSWWKFEIPFNIKKLLTDQIELKVISDNLYKFKQVNSNTDKIEDDYVDDKYYDAGNEPIRWMFMSQRLHFNLPNHYKNMKQLVFHMIQSTGHISTFNAQVKLYRNSVNYKDMEVIPFDFNFAVDEFRTFVKRFNYWKINLLQYGVANDDKAAVPARLVCNGIDIKYEIGDEVR